MISKSTSSANFHIKQATYLAVITKQLIYNIYINAIYYHDFFDFVFSAALFVFSEVPLHN